MVERLPGGVPATIPGALAWALDRWGADHPVLEDADGSLAAGALADRVARGVGHVRALGVRPGDRVAASLPNDRTILEAFLAVTSAGAIWVGLHEQLAAPEREALMSRCAPVVIIDDRDGWRRAVDDAAPGAAADVDPRSPAAIAWTSGTTGAPKGVVHSHRNLLVPAASFARSGRVEAGTRTGVAFPLTILNLVVQSILTALCAGATCCVLDRRDATGIVELVEAHGVEQISVVPATAYDIVHRGAGREVPSLRRVFVGGANVDVDLARALGRELGVVVEHGYGLTEAPGLVTLGTVDDRPLTAGRALPHVEVDVVDDEVVLRARVDGEWAGVWTPPLGRWGEPDQTYGDELRTGDAGLLDGDGNLTILDRRSELIIRGGSNVSPGEVERVLAAHPDVAAAVVVGRRDGRLGHVPVAVVEATVGADELVEHCRRGLAAYKVPEVRLVPTVQRNAMGKPDRTWARELVDEEERA